ncbi:MAG: hypothetical protein JNM17_10210 [Archangium sp.]|nr:hypothetical protein [Archangium sp.]
MSAKNDANAVLILGGLVAAFALMTMGVAVFLSVADPNQATLQCDRASGQCTRSGTRVTVPISALSTVQHEAVGDDGLRIVVDVNGEKVALSGGALTEKTQAEQAAAITQMRAFASSSEPSLSVSYAVGGGKAPTKLLWGSALGLIWGVVFVIRGLRARKVAPAGAGG